MANIYYGLTILFFVIAIIALLISLILSWNSSSAMSNGDVDSAKKWAMWAAVTEALTLLAMIIVVIIVFLGKKAWSSREQIVKKAGEVGESVKEKLAKQIYGEDVAEMIQQRKMAIKEEMASTEGKLDLYEKITNPSHISCQIEAGCKGGSCAPQEIKVQRQPFQFSKK